MSTKIPVRVNEIEFENGVTGVVFKIHLTASLLDLTQGSVDAQVAAGFIHKAMQGGLKLQLSSYEEDNKEVPRLSGAVFIRDNCPCPSCGTELRADEPNCWRCGWRR
jgi:hypothetical protein